MSKWRTASASVIGTSHLKHQTPCQDFSLCSLNNDTLICAVSDGAGTASHSDVGARIAVTHFIRSFRDIADVAAIDRDDMGRFLASLVELLDEEASNNQAAVSDYACTLLGVVASPSRVRRANSARVTAAIGFADSDLQWTVKYRCAALWVAGRCSAFLALR